MSRAAVLAVILCLLALKHPMGAGQAASKHPAQFCPVRISHNHPGHLQASCPACARTALLLCACKSALPLHSQTSLFQMGGWRALLALYACSLKGHAASIVQIAHASSGDACCTHCVDHQCRLWACVAYTTRRCVGGKTCRTPCPRGWMMGRKGVRTPRPWWRCSVMRGQRCVRM